MVSRTSFALLAILGAIAAPTSRTSTPSPNLLHGLTWRNLGPFRAGRVAAVSGAIGQPGVFYMGLPPGGGWKTTSGVEEREPRLAGAGGFPDAAQRQAHVEHARLADGARDGGDATGAEGAEVPPRETVEQV